MKNERFHFGDDAVLVDEVRELLDQQRWLEASFSAQQLAVSNMSGWAADPEGDGLANGFEYLLGLEPASHSVPPSGWLQAQIGLFGGPRSGPGRFGPALGYATDLAAWCDAGGRVVRST